LVGTIPFLSPEQFQGSFSFQTDILSLDIVVYNVMTFRYPFSRSDLASFMFSVVNKSVSSINEKYSSEFKTLVFLMLEKDPNKRITLNQILSNPLIFILEDSKECQNSAEEIEIQAKISKGDVDAMYNFVINLSNGIYGENRKQESEKYYLMAISKEHVAVMCNFANNLSKGCYVGTRKQESELHLKMFQRKNKLLFFFFFFPFHFSFLFSFSFFIFIFIFHFIFIFIFIRMFFFLSLYNLLFQQNQLKFFFQEVEFYLFEEILINNLNK
jgi:serine/threonine protein kinase